MGLYQRKDSPYWWMWIEPAEGGQARAASTKIYIDAPSSEQRRDNKRLAEQLYHRCQTSAHRQTLLDGSVPAVPRPRLTRSVEGWCYVYFVQMGDCVKIGRALDLERRLKTLQTAHAQPLRLLAAIPSHADLESAIQARFQHLHRRGEWFALDAELTEFIARLRAGENPVALLW